MKPGNTANPEGRKSPGPILSGLKTMGLSLLLLPAACQFGSPRIETQAASLAPAVPAVVYDTLTEKVKTGESFISIARGLDLPPQDIRMLLSAIRENFRFKLYAGQAYQVIRRIEPEGPALEAFRLEDRYAEKRHVLHRVGATPAPEDSSADAGALDYAVTEIPVRIDTAAVNGTLENNLYDAFVTLGETGALIHQVTHIFAWDLDFFRDPRVGDAFSLLVEKKFGEDGSFRGYGKVLSAKYVNAGREFTGILYGEGYYDEEGRSLEKMLMKAPLNYVRVSSGFSGARMHPVLGVKRPHWGIDYAGPLNTKILAAGDGVVEYAKWVNGYGKTIKIRHNGVYNTYYAHLNGYADRLRAGTRVRQGEVIGYMGRTGLATGVHLDYRVEYQGRYINPASLKMESKAGVAKAEWKTFCDRRDALFAMMSGTPVGSLAAAAPAPSSGEPQSKAF